jgi:AbrB family looped-hinge helix DNA binding protein
MTAFFLFKRLQSKNTQSKNHTMKITSKGQITIPQQYRERFGLLPQTEIEFVADAKGLRLRKSTKPGAKGPGLIQRMRGRGDGKLTTNEIMRLTRGGR